MRPNFQAREPERPPPSGFMSAQQDRGRSVPTNFISFRGLKKKAGPNEHWCRQASGAKPEYQTTSPRVLALYFLQQSRCWRDAGLLVADPILERDNPAMREQGWI